MSVVAIPVSLIPPDDEERLKKLYQYDILDTPQEYVFDKIAILASQIFDTPSAFITFVDRERVFFKSNISALEGNEVLRDASLCSIAILDVGTTIFADTHQEASLSDNPFVQMEGGIRFYAGAPLATYDGNNIGTLCVMDAQSKEVSENKKSLLTILAQQAIHLMELELTHKLLDEKMQQVEKQNAVLIDIAFIQSHEFRGPVASIMGLMNIIKEEKYSSPKEHLVMMEEAVNMLDEKVHKVVKSAEIAKGTYEQYHRKRVA